MAVFCLGCGSDLSRDRGRRLLRSDISDTVLCLWSHIIDGELEKKGNLGQLRSQNLLQQFGSHKYMCRSCFLSYQKYHQLRLKLSELASNTIKVLDENDRLYVSDETEACPPPVKRSAIVPIHSAVSGSSSCSPNVSVSQTIYTLFSILQAQHLIILL